jgi:glucose/mannose-6-phosphate isomerase
MSVLDDTHFIQKTDKSDALGLAAHNPKQLRHEFEQVNLNGAKITSVVLTGMGGSALGPKLLQSWVELPVPFVIVSDYSLPAFVDENTLVIASSFSGNTEETLSCLDEAEAKGCQVVCISNRGALEERAASAGHPFLKLPDCAQPRFAAFYSLRAVLTVFVGAQLLDEKYLHELRDAADFLEAEIKTMTTDVATEQNVAKQLALEIVGKSPVIYGGKTMVAAAYKWKISFNENAKNVAWWGVYPEFNHNEFIGWSSHPVDKPYAVIDLRSSYDHAQVQKRFEISDRLLSGQRPKAYEVHAKGESLLEQIIWTTTLGDFVTLYVALLNEIDPSPVDLVERMKKEL